MEWNGVKLKKQRSLTTKTLKVCFCAIQTIVYIFFLKKKQELHSIVLSRVWFNMWLCISVREYCLWNVVFY